MTGTRPRSGRSSPACVDSGRVTPQEGAALFDGETGQYLYEPYVGGGCPTCGIVDGRQHLRGVRGAQLLRGPGRPAADQWHGATPRAGTITRFTLPLHELRAEVLEHHHVGRAPARLRELAHRVFRRERLDVALSHPSEWGVRPTETDLPGQVIWVWIELAFGFIYGIERLGRTLGEDWQCQRAAGRLEDRPLPRLRQHLLPLHPRPGAVQDRQPGAGRRTSTTTSTSSTCWTGTSSPPAAGTPSGARTSWARTPWTAIRYYLALTRPETSRTNFTVEEYERVVEQTLVGTWQRWLNDLGARIEKRYGGSAPDAGIWTPEHTAFWAQLGSRLAEVTGALGQDGFSLNRAARALDGIVDRHGAVRQGRGGHRRPGGLEGRGQDRDRAGAGRGAAAGPLRDAGHAALRDPAGRRAGPGPARAVAGAGHPGAAGDPGRAWPARCSSARSRRRASRSQSADASAQPACWPGSDRVREALLLPAGQPVADATLVALGTTSLQAIALQYQVLEHTGADVSVEDLLGCRTVAAAGRLIAAEEVPAR